MTSRRPSNINTGRSLSRCPSTTSSSGSSNGGRSCASRLSISRTVSQDKRRSSARAGDSARTYWSPAPPTPASLSVYYLKFWEMLTTPVRQAGYTYCTDETPPEEIRLPEERFIRRAYRLKDGKRVVLRWVAARSDDNELEIMRYLNSADLRKEKRNHSVVMLETIQATYLGKSCNVLVLKHSGIMFHRVSFKTAEQWHAVILNIIEGLAFLHEHDISHGDIQPENFLINRATLRITIIDFERSVKGTAAHSRSPTTGLTPLEHDTRYLEALLREDFRGTHKRFPNEALDRLYDKMKTKPPSIDMQQVYQGAKRILARPSTATES